MDLCTVGPPECISHITRTIWDGDQILYEARFDGEAGAGDLDAVPAATASPGQTTRERYGWIGYTHGPQIDAPLDLMRSR